MPLLVDGNNLLHAVRELPAFRRLDRPGGARSASDEVTEKFPTDGEGMAAFFRVVIASFVTGRVPSAEDAARRKRFTRLPVQDHEILRMLWDRSTDPHELIARIRAYALGTRG